MIFEKDYPVKVKFVDVIAPESSFVEKGMVAYLTKVEINENKTDWATDDRVFNVYFNQTPFMEQNEILLTNCYTRNKFTPNNTNRDFFTAKEAGYFDERWVDIVTAEGDQTIEEALSKYIKIIE